MPARVVAHDAEVLEQSGHLRVEQREVGAERGRQEDGRTTVEALDLDPKRLVVDRQLHARLGELARFPAEARNARAGEPSRSSAGVPILDHMMVDLETDLPQPYLVLGRSQTGMVERRAAKGADRFATSWTGVEHQHRRA